MNKTIKKIGIGALALGVMLIGLNAYAFSAGTYRVQQRDPSNSTFQNVDIDPPAGGVDGIWGYFGSTKLGKMMTYGTGLTNDGTAINVANVPIASITNLQSSLDAKAATSSLATVATSGAYNDLTGKPSLATVATSGSYTDLTNKPAARTQSSASRTLNNCFQVSSTRDSLVNYSVDVGTSLTLTSGQTGTVFLEMYSDSGCTTGTQELSRAVNGNGGSLTIGLNLSQNVTAGVMGYVPAGSYVKIRTANTVGTPTFTYRSGQEVLM